MAINIHTNVPAMTGQRHLSNAMNSVDKSMERLSSGYRINSAKDDAAGLQLSNRLNAESQGIDVALRNIHDGISVAQTAEGALHETTDILQGMRELTLQAANGSNTKAERVAIQQAISAMNDELNGIANSTIFADVKLLNGSHGTRAFQIGPDTDAVQLTLRDMRSTNEMMGGVSYQAEEVDKEEWRVSADSGELTMSFTDNFGKATDIEINAKAGDDIEELATYINGQQELLKASVSGSGELQIFASNSTVQGEVSFSGSLADELGFGGGDAVTVDSIDVTSVGGAQESVAVVDSALRYVDSHRAELGAFQNRFSYAINNLENMSENVKASKSQIKNTDFARETAALTSTQILQQASTSVLAQAKQLPNAAVSLLG